MNASAPWVIAALLAGAIAVGAWRAGSLQRSGAVAACVVGTLALSAAWSWGVFLVGWFVLSSVLSRVGRARKVARTRAIVEKGDQRDAWQVLANGGVFALASLAFITQSAWAWPALSATTLAVAAAAALVAAGADTWGTEVGTLWGSAPWSLRDRKAVPAGTSGAITITGSAGAIAGALVLTALATVTGMIPPSQFWPVAIGGVVGSWTDTLIGAWIQERRVCPACENDTERLVHDCGTPTTRTGGVAQLNNDAVNALCTLSGALVALLLARP